ncbi:hypothetical protein QTH90_21100 [Variovorax sp. J2P1-59]|uniref:hypothetical protein n=1 Tax=Variovorax flavidus TaxID=3053501 RepID=UPI0025782518|nr:hypothetical protein [Variovorax sp. J2P1-59]MDM0076920.1 hypothetical protein [Variovorax sp. J2P1-59]
MHILGPGRPAFLEFLRNLTPMVLLASIAFVTWAQLDFRVDLDNWKTTMVFWICFITAALSIAANMIGFLEKAVAFPLGLERGIRRLRFRGHSDPLLVGALFKMALRAKPAVVAEAVIAVVVIYGAMIASIMSASSVALTALKNGVR